MYTTYITYVGDLLSLGELLAWGGDPVGLAEQLVVVALFSYRTEARDQGDDGASGITSLW